MPSTSTAEDILYELLLKAGFPLTTKVEKREIAGKEIYKEKTLFDAIEYESEVEKQFAMDLDNNESVRLFVKLPSWFKIDTPIGPYNPDWAFVTEREQKLYFVRETKATLDSEERRTKENQKIACGRKHFDTIGVDFDVVTSLSEVAIR